MDVSVSSVNERNICCDHGVNIDELGFTRCKICTKYILWECELCYCLVRLKYAKYSCPVPAYDDGLPNDLDNLDSIEYNVFINLTSNCTFIVETV